MKKIVLIFIFICAVTFTVTSCKKEPKKEPKKEMATTVYQCPMDCEKGKSYTKAGNCPVCKMALKEKTAGEKSKTEEKHVHKEGDNHEH